ncbi:MAG: hypothetical protein IIC00_10875 [Planctomycetes bacterium]|nr:hypothetical protein [Planctomycetota bacterium]
MMTKEELETLWRDKDNWLWGAIYYCKKDPRLVVPKRIKWTGWTMNFAYPWRAIGFIIFIILAASLPFIIELKLNIATSVVISITLAVVVVLIIGLCAYLSSRTE